MNRSTVWGYIRTGPPISQDNSCLSTYNTPELNRDTPAILLLQHIFAAAFIAHINSITDDDEATAACFQLNTAWRRVSGALPRPDTKVFRQVKRVLFIPYALHDRDAYARIARQKFESLGYALDSIHEAADPVDSVLKSEAIFIGGGNTFRLLKALYDNNLIPVIRKKVIEDGIPYIGSSAGTNVATISINTTNDMPIVYPPSVEALQLVKFNINPHYLDTDVNSKHMGETREQRIRQYHEEPDTPPVLALREGCMLLVEGNKATLLGITKARLFLRGKSPTEHEPDEDFSFLLNQ
ncbi:alpha-aspartyl dipeptidase-like isoform X1 [Hyla sarda]|uniref:alpha-aspartyl dipeptidase-like isoform X1 n=1 Tax=Hyla sarda TaxID=327740 RepID=UPI0024C4620D|nr:alpha-aspartyl dipeptidase-like isoform X1 [Hyla sarda]